MSGMDWGARSGELLAALETVDGLQVVSNPVLPIRPPAAVLLPPTFTWGAVGDGEPDGFAALLAIVEPADDLGRALENLIRWVPLVSTAIERKTPDAIVTRATPGSLQTSGTGTSQYPCYYLEIAL